MASCPLPRLDQCSHVDCGLRICRSGFHSRRPSRCVDSKLDNQRQHDAKAQDFVQVFEDSRNTGRRVGDLF